jgi:hypothetical protein
MSNASRPTRGYATASLVLVCSLIISVAQARPQTPPQPQSQDKAYDQLLVKARTSIADKKPQEAVEQSEQAIQLNDKRWEAYVTAASGYSAQQLYDDAIGMLQMALVRAPQDKKQLVRDAISEARRQVSGSNSSAATPTAVKPQASTSAAAQTTAPTQAEAVLWKSIETSKNPDDYRAYLKAYPNGAFAPLAEQRITSLTANPPQSVIKTQTDWLREKASVSAPATTCTAVKGKYECRDYTVPQEIEFVNGCHVGLLRDTTHYDLDFTRVNDSGIRLRKQSNGPGYYLDLSLKGASAMPATGAVRGRIGTQFLPEPRQGGPAPSPSQFSIYFADGATADEALQRTVELAMACAASDR